MNVQVNEVNLRRRLVVAFMQILGELSQRLKIASQNGIHENGGFFFSISRRRIHGVGLNDHSFTYVVGHRWVECGDGSVVGKAMVAADHAETEDVVFVVENLEAFGAAAGGKAGDDVNLPEGSDVAVADDYVAALDEVLVGLRVVKPPDHRPDGGYGGGDFLDHGGAGLVRPYRMRVVNGHRFRHLEPFLVLFLAMD